MKRLTGMVAGLVATVALGLVLGGAGGDDADGYRVDAIFKNASFLIPGQVVKIAGAEVGTVEDVTLTDDLNARIEMLVDDRFGPFNADATCTIQPQSLIGEKFVQCSPGTPRAQPLTAQGDSIPTIPIENTVTPVDLDLVLGAFRDPVPTQLALLFSALGGGLTGRAEDLEETIRRSDPAFKEVEKLLTLVNEDRDTIRALIAESDQLVGDLDARREDVADFISAARSATEPTARRQAELRETISELPGFLAAARPAFRELRRLGEDGAPIVAELGEAAPAGTRLIKALSPFSEAAEPALEALGEAAADGRSAVKPAAPQVRRLRRFAEAARPTAVQLRDLLVSVTKNGAFEGLLKFTYWGAAAISRFDSVSHILPAQALVHDTCNLYATHTVESCSTHFEAGEATAGARAEKKPEPRSSEGEKEQPAPAPQAEQAPAPQEKAPEAAAPKPAPAVPDLGDVVGSLPKALEDTVQGLLGPGRDGTTPKALEQLEDGVGGLLRGERGARPGRGAANESLLDFLLGG